MCASRILLPAVAAVVACLVAGVAGAGRPTDPARELGAIRGQIHTLEQEISKAAAARPTAGDALKQAETAESGARQAVSDIQRQLAEGRARERELRRRIDELQARLTAGRAALEAQLRVAYISGRQQSVRLVLAEQDPAVFSRKLAYYGYLARQRSALLAEIERQLDALDTAARELQEQLERLRDLGARREARLEQVAAARKVRALALETLDRDIGARQDRLERLQQQAKAFEQLLARLERERRRDQTREAPPPPVKGFGRVTDLPLRGRVLGDFGQPRADGLLRWDGLLIEAPPGTEVRVVRGGRVVYADYLPGMGQLLVVDHGDGYMSLYGHNQDLARKTGDRVGQGEIIAHVGDSGGEGNPGLYFELRRNGRPVNPHAWVR